MTQEFPSFEAFLEGFPVEQLPVTLTEESISGFQSLADPLNPLMIAAYIDETYVDTDEFTEYVPCFRIPDTHDFHAIVVWKGELLSYQYFLVTFDKNGKQIASAIIGGLKVEGDSILRSVVTLEEDWKLHIVEGEQPTSEELYNPGNTNAFQMELLATGEIVQI